MRRLLSRIDGQDIAIVLGLLLVGVGAGLVYLPAGLIVVGAVLLALAIWRM